MGVLLENVTTSGTQVAPIFLTGGDIDDVISRFFSVGQFVYIIKRKLHGGLKI